MAYKEINKAIEECKYRQEINGEFICRGMLLPCVRTIDRGECPTLIKLFRNEKQMEVEDE